MQKCSEDAIRCDYTNFNRFVAVTSRRNRIEFVRLVAATKNFVEAILTKILQDTRSNLSQRRRSDVSPRSVAATCCLVSTDLYVYQNPSFHGSRMLDVMLKFWLFFNLTTFCSLSISKLAML